MDNTKSVVLMGLDNEVVQITAFDRLFLVTRSDFSLLQEKSRMLEMVIYGGGDLSVIRHIFDDATSVEDVTNRFKAWIIETGGGNPLPPIESASNA